MLLMIDNYDSFTYNLVQYFGELGQEVKVFRNDAISLARRPQQQARRNRTRFSRVPGDRGAFRFRSARTAAISPRVRIFVASAARVRAGFIRVVPVSERQIVLSTGAWDSDYLAGQRKGSGFGPSSPILGPNSRSRRCFARAH